MPKIKTQIINELNSQKGIIHLLPIIAIAFLALAVAASSQIKTIKKFNPSSKVGGVLIAHGDIVEDYKNEDSDQENKETPKPSEFKAKETPKPTEKPREKEPIKIKPILESTSSAFNKLKKRGESEKFLEKNKPEIKKDKTTFKSGEIKLKYEIQNGEVRIEKEIEHANELEKEDLDDIENKIKELEFKVSTSEGKLLIQKNKAGAISNFPLQLDLETKQLIASTSAGARILTVLPDQAIENMLKASIFTKLVNSENAVGDSGIAEVMQLGEKNGIPVYKISGIKKHLLFGLIPLETEVEAEVSAETGDLLATEQSMLSQVIDFLSN